MTYLEKLKDPRWQKKRLEILSRDEFTCRSCGSPDKTLHVHHQFYFKSTDPWDYPDHLLITLCENCHSYEESLKEQAQSDMYKAFLDIGLLNSDIIQLAEVIKEVPNIGFYPIHHLFIKYILTDKVAKQLMLELYEQKRAEEYKDDPFPF